MNVIAAILLPSVTEKLFLYECNFSYIDTTCYSEVDFV